MFILILLGLSGEPATMVAAYDTASDCFDVLESFTIAAPEMAYMLTCEKELIQ